MIPQEPTYPEGRRIVSARTTAHPRRLGDPLPEVWATFDDGEEELLFTYYPDEITFTEAEFVGLAVEEARLLKFGRDRAHLWDACHTQSRHGESIQPFFEQDEPPSSSWR